jgi:hypothetical protein
MGRISLPGVMALGAVLVAGLGQIPTGESALGRSCATGGTTLDANRYARLFRRGDRFINAVYACLRDGRRRFIGEQTDLASGTYIYRLSGRFVAHDTLICAYPERCVAVLEVEDVRTGKVVRGTTDTDPGSPVQDLVVTPAGRAAWIRATATTRQVLRFDAAGRPAVLDEGPDIRSGSLALTGTTLYWIHGEQPRTAQLTG